MLRKTTELKLLLPIIYCLGLAIFYLYDNLLRVLPSVVSNGINESYHLSSLTYGYVCALYYFVYVPLQLVVGLLVDRYQLMKIIAIALLFCSVGCCLFANARILWLAELGRMMMGFGMGFVFISVLKTITLRLSRQHFTLYLGIIFCIGMLGGLLMDSVLVFTVGLWGWRLVCYFLAIVGLVLVGVNFSYLKVDDKFKRFRSKKQSFVQDFNYLKNFLMNRRILVQCLIGALLYMPIAGFAESWGVQFLNHSSGLSKVFASIDMSMLFLGFAFGAPFLGWCYDKTKQYQIILTVGAVGTTILLSIVLYVPGLSGTKIGFFLFLLGFFSASVVVILSLNREMVSKKNTGKIFGVTNFIMMSAGGVAWVIGLLIYLVAKNTFAEILPIYTITNYQLAFIILPCGSLLAVFLTFFVRHES